MAPNWKTSPTHRRLGASRGQAVTSRSGGAERTYEDLYEEAKRRDISGRSKMSKTELERALGGR